MRKWQIAILAATVLMAESPLIGWRFSAARPTESVQREQRIISPSMSAPWFTLWNKIKASVGNDPTVKVAELDQSVSPYKITITVKERAKAEGIASLVKPRHQFGHIAVLVIVKNAGNEVAPVVPKSAQDLVNLVKSAFDGNEWYKRVETNKILGKIEVFPIFERGVIQFNNDDLSDAYGNYNGVVAEVFKEVLLEWPGGIPLLCSTDEK